MSINPRKPFALGGTLFLACIIILLCYFSFAAIQGNFGLFRRIQIEAQEAELKLELTELMLERKQLTNNTHRLSDDFLDLELLDERARSVLGMARPDEIIIQ